MPSTSAVAFLMATILGPFTPEERQDMAQLMSRLVESLDAFTERLVDRGSARPGAVSPGPTGRPPGPCTLMVRVATIADQAHFQELAMEYMPAVQRRAAG